MPTNEQRRQAAKRKLERQLERREERARKRRQLTVTFSVVGLVVVVGAVALLVSVTRGGGDSTAAADTGASSAAPTSSGAATSTAAPVALPTARKTPLAATVSCTYTAGGTASKANTVPKGTGISTAGTVAVTMTTSAGAVPLTLDRALAPCTVNSFLSLTSQKYFDSTPCHRLTTSGIKVLQCGDPTGKGTGGPGYAYANEFPTDQYSPEDPAAQATAIYPRGTIAMANSGADTNGSQFFLVYDDSPLPPQYTVFGTIGSAGLTVLEKIAAAGTTDGSGDGAPKTPVTITTMTAAA